MSANAMDMIRILDAIIRDDANLFLESVGDVSADHLLVDHTPTMPASGYFTDEFGWYVDGHLTQLVLVVADVPGARMLARALCLDNYIHFGTVGDSINLCSAAKIVSLMNDPHILVEWRPASDAAAGIKTLTEFVVNAVYNAINIHNIYETHAWDAAVETMVTKGVEWPSELTEADQEAAAVKEMAAVDAAGKCRMLD